MTRSKQKYHVDTRSPTDFREQRLGLGHLKGLHALLNDANVAGWLGGGRSLEEVQEFVRNDEAQWARIGFGTLVAID